MKKGYYELGQIVINSKKIIINYLKHDFWYNILAVGSLIFIINYQRTEHREDWVHKPNIILLLFFLKFKDLSKIEDHL